MTERAGAGAKGEAEEEEADCWPDTHPIVDGDATTDVGRAV